MKFVRRLVAFFTVSSLLSLSLVGQAGPPSGQDAPAQTSTQNQSTPQASGGKDANAKGTEDKAEGAKSGTSNDRLFYALPNFLTLENSDQVPPLTSKQKFAAVARGSFDPIEFPWWGIIAAIGQANNSEPAFGQGWGAYAKRYGTTAGDSLVENFMVGALFPSVLHQDPRFFQSSKGGFGRRFGYAVSRVVVTRADSGHAQFNYSEIFGSATAAAISTFSYHPRSTYVSTPTNPHMFVASDRTLGNAGKVWGSQIGLDTATIIVKEFWPDIRRKMSHQSKPGGTGTTTR